MLLISINNLYRNTISKNLKISLTLNFSFLKYKIKENKRKEGVKISKISSCFRNYEQNINN